MKILSNQSDFAAKKLNEKTRTAMKFVSEKLSNRMIKTFCLDRKQKFDRLLTQGIQ